MERALRSATVPHPRNDPRYILRILASDGTVVCTSTRLSNASGFSADYSGSESLGDNSDLGRHGPASTRAISAVTPPQCQVEKTHRRMRVLELGNFSVSLAVKDIAASRLFYEKLGFTVFFGDQTQNWLIMKNGDHAIGLFQGMFDSNIITFNPGWDTNAQPLKEFTDVRQIQRQLKDNGITFMSEADETSTGPASFMIADPDGNTILFDQHV